jgi:(2Fe-2S) ferredoxin
MADVSKVQFSLVGRFKAFLPGKKSPYQRLLLEVAPPQANLPATYQIRLGKDLRKKARRELTLQDKVSVIGKLSHKRNGKLKWRATKISKLSVVPMEAQIEAIKGDTRSPEPSPPAKKTSGKSKPLRILVCQKSSCRRRGSVKVAQAMEAEMAARHGSPKVIVQSTGCLKGCKAGPNAVVIPGKKQRQVRHTHLTPKKGRSLIHNILMS